MPTAAATLDWLVLALYLGALLWVGRRARGKEDLDGFLFGGRSLPWWAILGSIVATETSSATFLSVPGLSYREGGSLWFLQLALGYCLGRLLVAGILLPGYFRGRIDSAYQLLGTRFGGGTRRLASATFLVTRCIGDGLRLFLTAAALEAFMGVPFLAGLLGLSLVTLWYTASGGLRSVVWNDCLQFVVYLLGGLLAFRWALLELPGGFKEFVAFGLETGRLRVFEFSFDWSRADTLWAGLIGGAVLTLGTHGADQMMVQRCLAAGNLEGASRALLWSGPVVLGQFVLFLCLGVALAAVAANSPAADPLPDRAVAEFLAQAGGFGLQGLFAAAIAAAAMSTLSSSLNSAAAVWMADFWQPMAAARGATPSPAEALSKTRWATLVFALLQVLVAWLARSQSESVVSEVLAVAGFSAGLLLGLFLLGQLVPRADSRSALIGFSAGLLALLAARFLGPSLDFRLAWPWYAALGAGMVLLVGTLVPPRVRVALPGAPHG